METVNSVAAAAARAVWGDTTANNETKGQEPVSGKVGDTNKGEPYDAGNLGTTAATGSTSEFSKNTGTGSTPTTGLTNETTPTNFSKDTSTDATPSVGLTDRTKPTDFSQNTESEPYVAGDINSNTTSTNVTKPADFSQSTGTESTPNTRLTDKTTSTDFSKTGTDSTANTGLTNKTTPSDFSKNTDTDATPNTGSTDETKAAHFSKNTGTATTDDATPNTASTEMKMRDQPEDTTTGQNDTRDPEDPQTHPKSAPTDVNDADEGVNSAQTLDGPGPKPLDEVAHEHGGDAGKEGNTASTRDTPDNADKNLGEKGTGEQYVKSSGLKADGGDFDATKPGAGKEADRLMETKGIHNPNEDAKHSSHEGSGDTTEKKSLGQKIKEKLHKH